jgi:hypothetical protein
MESGEFQMAVLPLVPALGARLREASRQEIIDQSRTRYYKSILTYDAHISTGFRAIIGAQLAELNATAVSAARDLVWRLDIPRTYLWPHRPT